MRNLLGESILERPGVIIGDQSDVKVFANGFHEKSCQKSRDHRNSPFSDYVVIADSIIINLRVLAGSDYMGLVR
jgi:hypothetical protein